MNRMKFFKQTYRNIFTLMIIMATAMAWLPSAEINAQVIYVNASASDDGDGSTWGMAFNDLQDALSAASAGDEIWVATGVYTPVTPDDPENVTTSERQTSIEMIDGVEIYGGFAGTESEGFDLDDRDFETNPTVLSGNIVDDPPDDPDDAIEDAGALGDFSFHVVDGSGADDTAILDGFTITGGYAFANSGDNIGGGVYVDNGSPQLANLLIEGNSASGAGGGIYNDDGSPVLTNLTISGNTASGNGGGIFNGSGTPALTNLTISDNTAFSNGGGIYNHNGSPVLTNLTIAENTAGSGGGIFNNSGSPILTNLTISGNTANDDGDGIYINHGNVSFRNTIVWANNGGSPVEGFGDATYNFSLVQGITSADEDGNLDGGLDPLFTDPDNGDFSLQLGSPAINAGNNTYFDDGETPDLSDITTDRAGNDRIQKVTLDLGAYESSFGRIDPDGDILYIDREVDTDASGYTGSGSTWDDAVADLSDALAWANDEWDGSGTLQIWVATGVYTPVTPNDPESVTTSERQESFELIDGVEIYGGFEGNEGTGFDPDERDFDANPTVLSGNIVDAPDDPSEAIEDADDLDDFSFHVVDGSGTDDTATLDGFTITGGNADGGSGDDRFGGGVFIDSGSPQLANLLIDGNSASIRGGGIFNDNGSPTLTNLTISGNTANSNEGGGIYNLNGSPALSNLTISGNTAGSQGGGIFNQSGSPTLTDLTISDNTAGHNGGGIYNRIGSPVLTNLTISGNTADNNGGGIFSWERSPVLTNLTITGNTAGNRGGGIYNRIGSPVLTNLTISGNTAGSRGGGIYNDRGSPVLTNLIISGNTAGHNGGGIFNDDGSPTLTNLTISGNTASSLGGGVYILLGNVSFRNTIVWGNSNGPQVELDTNASATYAFSLVQGITSADGDGNLDGSLDPLFTDPDNGDYTLRNISLAINAGSNTYFDDGESPDLSDITTDRAGNPRIFDADNDGVIDLGAYEFQGEPILLPEQIVLSEPANSAQNMALQPELGWAALDAADTYELQISANEDLSDPIIDTDGLTETTLQVSDDLGHATTYHWRVRAVNAAGSGPWSEPFSFTTIPQAPGQVTLSTPANQTNNIELLPSLSWQTVSGADTYTLIISQNSDLSDPIVSETGITEDSFTLTQSLESSTTYWWTVRGVNPGGDGSWSETFSFTTVPQAPDQVVLSAPSDEAQNIALQAFLSWQAASGADSYELQLSANEDLSDPLVATDGLTETDFQISDDLGHATTYHWRVRGVNPGGDGSWSETFNFTTVPEAPGQVALSSPGNGTQNVVLLTSFSWQSVSGSDSYDLIISQNNDLSNPIDSESGINGTGFTLSQPLQNSTTYWWGVRGVNAGGEGAWSEPASFTTIPQAPEQVVLTSPSDGADEQDLIPLFSWDEATGADFYQFELSTEPMSTFSGGIIHQADSETASLTLPDEVDLLRETTYRWRVRAVNTGGNGPWSIIHTFTTESVPVPQQLSLTVEDNELVLEWDYPSDTPINGFHFYEGPSSTELEVAAELDGQARSFITSLPQSSSWFYAVRAIDEQDIEGSLSEPANLSSISGSIPSQWELISIPVKDDGIELDRSVLYGFEQNYVRTDRAVGGQGYWARSAVQEEYSFFGAGLTAAQIELRDGWNLVGGPTEQIDVSSIDDPDGILSQAQIFAYVNDAYLAVDVLEPFIGYWMFATKPGEITLSLTADQSPAEGAKDLAEVIEPTATLRFSSGGSVQQIDLTPDGVPADERIWWLLPPIAPEPALDVRTEEGLSLMDNRSTALNVIARNWPVNVRMDGEPAEVNYLYRIQARHGDDIVYINLLPGQSAQIHESYSDLQLEYVHRDEVVLETEVFNGFPNPFNPSIQLKYQLAMAEDVSMQVYNLLGRRVATLVNARQQPGNYTVQFNGSELASGVYFIRFHAGSLQHVQKISLIK